MAALFDCTTDNISLHLKNIFADKELDEISVVEDFSVTAADGKNYRTKHYNLDAIIANEPRTFGSMVRLLPDKYRAGYSFPAMGNGGSPRLRPAWLCDRPKAHGKRRVS